MSAGRLRWYVRDESGLIIHQGGHAECCRVYNHGGGMRAGMELFQTDPRTLRVEDFAASALCRKRRTVQQALDFDLPLFAGQVA